MSYELSGLGRMGFFGTMPEVTTSAPPCPQGYAPADDGSCYRWADYPNQPSAAVKCKPGLVPDASGKYCVQPAGTVPAPGQPPAMVCPDGFEWNQAYSLCFPKGQIPQIPMPNTPVPAPQGSCPAGQVKDPTGLFCVPAGMVGPQPLPPAPIPCAPGSVWNGLKCVAGIAPVPQPVAPQPPTQQAGLMQSTGFWVVVVGLSIAGLYALASARPRA